MVSMKMSDEERAEYSDSVMAEQPNYPYGLRISLDDDALEKLGIVALPQVDATMKITAIVKVASVSSYQISNGDKECCVTLQITDMEVGSNKDADYAAKKLYGG